MDGVAQSSFLGAATLESRVSRLEDTLIPAEVNLTYIEDNITILQGNVSTLEAKDTFDNLNIINELNAFGSVNFGDTIAFTEGGTFNGSITSELNTYTISGGQSRTSSIFKTGTVLDNTSAYLQQTRMSDFTPVSATSLSHNVGKESSRRVFNFTGGTNITFTLNMQQPYDNVSDLYLPLENDFLLCSLDQPRNFSLIFNMILDDGSTYSGTWAFGTLKEYAGGGLVQALSILMNGPFVLPVVGVQGEIRFRIKSCGNGIGGDGAFLIDIEVYK